MHSVIMYVHVCSVYASLMGNHLSYPRLIVLVLLLKKCIGEFYQKKSVMNNGDNMVFHKLSFVFCDAAFFCST